MSAPPLTAAPVTATPDAFLPPGAHVVALPNATAPRLVLTSTGVVQRWRHSALYPAYRATARAYRVALRLRTALGLVPTRRIEDGDWPLRAFLANHLPEVDATVVAPGTQGPASKTTVQLWHGPRVVGYLKHARTPAARARLAREHAVLTALPPGLAPRVLHYGAFAEGQALVTTPVAGRPVPVRLPLDGALRAYLARLERPESAPVAAHPWVVAARARMGADLEPWLAPLADRAWPVVHHHGDFAPWNVLRGADGALTAIDWEHGSPQGFPHLDAAYFLLQVSLLIRRWPPDRARAYAVAHLDADLPAAQADALVRIAALDAFHAEQEAGHPPDAPDQVWWRAVGSAR